MNRVIEILEASKVDAERELSSLKSQIDAAEAKVDDFDQAITLLKDFIASQ